MCSGDFPELSPAEIVSAGQTLFGAGWRHALAHRLGISESQLVQVEAGQAPVPRDWRGRLVALAQDVALKAMDTASALALPAPVQALRTAKSSSL